MYFLAGIISSFVLAVLAFFIHPKKLETVKQVNGRFNIGKIKIDDLMTLRASDLKRLQKFAYTIALKTLSFSVILGFIFMYLFEYSLVNLFICLGLQLLFAFLFLYNFVTEAEKMYDDVIHQGGLN